MPTRLCHGIGKEVKQVTKPTGRPRGRPRKYAPGEERPKRKRKPKKPDPPRGTKKLPRTKNNSPDLPLWWGPLIAEVEENGGFVELAKASVGISRKTPESYIEDHPELRERYAEEIDAAKRRALERTLAEGFRRGVKGYKEPLTHLGKRTGHHIERRSDTLLMFFANAHGVGTQVPAQVNFNFDEKAMDAMDVDLLERLAKGENPAQIVAEWRTRQAEKKGGA